MKQIFAVTILVPFFNFISCERNNRWEGEPSKTVPVADQFVIKTPDLGVWLSHLEDGNYSYS